MIEWDILLKVLGESDGIETVSTEDILVCNLFRMTDYFFTDSSKSNDMIVGKLHEAR